MRLAKYVKNRVFYPIFGQKWPFSRISGPIPRISEGQKPSKNADEVSGFLRYFSPKSQYMGPLQTPKSWKFKKIHDFGRPATPPKIIKNRLNFACSKIPWKGPISPVWTAKLLPPPKIIKNRLNFAHSAICEKFDF